MALNDEQAKQIKEQLIMQVNQSFPEERKASTIEYINSMTNEQLEEFLKKNNMATEEGAEEEVSEQSTEKPKNGCIMCLISSKKVDSLPLYEDKDYLAVLELNPFTKGHAILIPKEHIAETKLLKSKAFTVANKIGKHIVKKLAAENFQITSSDDLKHALINIIPVYKNEKLDFKRKPAKKEDLQKIAMEIGSMEKKKNKPKKKEEKKEEKDEVKKQEISYRRIP